MACEPAVSEFEAAYLTMLADASIFAADGDTLTLSNDSDTVLATFTAGLMPGARCGGSVMTEPPPCDHDCA